MSWPVELLISCLGLGLFIGRLWHRGSPPTKFSSTFDAKVSIIVPCRNESSNIEALLESLLNLQGVDYEILIVDDASTDDTIDRVSSYLKQAPQILRLISAPEKPEGWVGKSWACWIGAQEAKGEYLLFTDADTRHESQSLRRAIDFLQMNHADLVSAPPFHQCGQWWEKLLGLFHLLPLVATRFSSVGPHRDIRPGPGLRLFAIGQYLLFRRSLYVAIDGHRALRESLAEDIDFAKRVAAGGSGTYAVYPTPGLYRVQMYRSFSQFFTGWSRLMRVGLPRVSLGAVAEIVLIFHLFLSPTLALVPALLFLLWVQRWHGAFSIWGVLLAPGSLLLFCAVTLNAQIDQILRKGLTWHGRTYPV